MRHRLQDARALESPASRSIGGGASRREGAHAGTVAGGCLADWASNARAVKAVVVKRARASLDVDPSSGDMPQIVKLFGGLTKQWVACHGPACLVARPAEGFS
jgi:hypothetical protein